MFNIFKLFKKKKENKKVIEADDFIQDNEIDIISNILNQSEKSLKKDNKDWRHLDVNYIKIFKEFERQQREYLIRFEFLPKQQNFRNARSALQYFYGDYLVWKKVRDKIEENFGGVCKICGKTSQENEPNKEKIHTARTECHEIWSFNEITKIQKLEDLEPLCNRCHSIKHINRHFKDIPLQNSLFKDYERINSIEEDQRFLDYEFSLDYQKKLNDIKFDMDLTLLNNLDLGINLDSVFRAHTDKFNGFLEVKFKNQKDLEE